MTIPAKIESVKRVYLRQKVRSTRARSSNTKKASACVSFRFYVTFATRELERGPTVASRWTMIDFEIQKFSRRCASTGRELGPGEVFYSVLVAEGAEVVRLDYSAESWSGPPDNAIGWWKSEVPDPKAQRLQWAPNDVMLHYFQQILPQEDKQQVCYVLTLLMIRRRIFKMEATERDDQGREVLHVYCSKTEEEYQVPVCTPTEEDAAEIQNELAELLFARSEPTKAK